jgi:hypothetical protein
MNVLLLRWDTKPDKRIRGAFLRPASTRRTSFYAAMIEHFAGWASPVWRTNGILILDLGSSSEARLRVGWGDCLVA